MKLGRDLCTLRLSCSRSQWQWQQDATVTRVFHTPRALTYLSVLPHLSLFGLFPAPTHLLPSIPPVLQTFRPARIPSNKLLSMRIPCMAAHISRTGTHAPLHFPANLSDKPAK